jgi:hypothetical protein
MKPSDFKMLPSGAAANRTCDAVWYDTNNPFRDDVRPREPGTVWMGCLMHASSKNREAACNATPVVAVYDFECSCGVCKSTYYVCGGCLGSL